MLSKSRGLRRVRRVALGKWVESFSELFGACTPVYPQSSRGWPLYFELSKRLLYTCSQLYLSSS